MKNFFKTFVLAILMVGGILMPKESNAQVNFGGNVGYFTFFSGGYGNPYLQLKGGYLINDAINIRADFMYGFPKKVNEGIFGTYTENIMQFAVGVSYWIETPSNARIYPLLSIGNLSYRVFGVGIGEFAMNIGGGALFPVSDNLYLGGEMTFGLPIGLFSSRIAAGLDVRYVLD